MINMEGYVLRGRHFLQKWAQNWHSNPYVTGLAWLMAGFCLSAASLGNRMVPLCLAVLCAGVPGWLPLAFCLGSLAGYRIFWGIDCCQAMIWLAGGLSVCALVAQTGIGRAMPMLQPALAALIVAAGGVILQLWTGDSTPIWLYFLHIVLALGSTWLCIWYRDRRDPMAGWMLISLAVLAMAQISPFPGFGLGFLLGAVLVAVMPFPAVALAGLALDLAQITPVPMTAVLCLSYLVRLLPRTRRSWMALAPVTVYGIIMALCGYVDLLPLLPLTLGGVLGMLLPRQNAGKVHRRGETGFAQVRLELAAEVMAQSERLLLEYKEPQLEEAMFIRRAAEQACGSCACRNSCKSRADALSLPGQLLRTELSSVEAICFPCRKKSRLLQELRHSQERLRTLQAERDRRQEYRAALLQQYRFLAEYLQDLADRLPRRGHGSKARYEPLIAACAAGREKENGDKCLWFAGTECRYYLLICDGMGTGQPAAREAGLVADMLRRLLMAGYPAPYALRSINSLCSLRGEAGAVTVDLAECCLDNGKVTLYKWGAAASWLLHAGAVERLGEPTPPPGLSVQEGRETVYHLSLRRGETLVLVSDGVDGAAVKNARANSRDSASILADRILAQGKLEDDATVAVIRLQPI